MIAAKDHSFSGYKSHTWPIRTLRFSDERKKKRQGSSVTIFRYHIRQFWVILRIPFSYWQLSPDLLPGSGTVLPEGGTMRYAWYDSQSRELQPKWGTVTGYTQQLQHRRSTDGRGEATPCTDTSGGFTRHLEASLQSQNSCGGCQIFQSNCAPEHWPDTHNKNLWKSEPFDICIRKIQIDIILLVHLNMGRLENQLFTSSYHSVIYITSLRTKVWVKQYEHLIYHCSKVLWHVRKYWVILVAPYMFSYDCKLSCIDYHSEERQRG